MFFKAFKLIVYPDPFATDGIELEWPENVQVPGWGDSFIYRGDSYCVIDREWNHDLTPQGLQVTCHVYLDQGEEYSEEA